MSTRVTADISRPGRPPLIRTISAWRGLLALTVVMFHTGQEWSRDPGYSSVTFFFLSSAFLLAMRYRFDRFTFKDYRRFAVGHALRLYPLHWLGLALLVLIASVWHCPFDREAAVLNALLVQAWFPQHGIHYGINPVAWYMSALLFCYLIFPAVARWLGPWRLRYKALLMLALAVALAVVLLPLDIPRREAVFVNPLSHILDVVAGLTLYHLYKVVKPRLGGVTFGMATLIEAAAIGLLALTMAVHQFTTWMDPWEDVLIWVLPQCAIIGAMALLNGNEGAVGRLLLSRPLQWLGSISFEVYVLHMAAFWLFNYYVAAVAGHFGWNIYGCLEWFSLPVLLPLAWAVNRWFTRPLSNRLIRCVNQ